MSEQKQRLPKTRSDPEVREQIARDYLEIGGTKLNLEEATVQKYEMIGPDQKEWSSIMV